MDTNALLGQGSEFEGKLTFEGTVRIDGRFTGEISSDGHLVIGESAQVQAEIRVANVSVHGTVNGNIHASNGVELHAPATLRGNIVSPALHIDKGVFFEGNCQMSSRPAAQPAATAPAARQRQPSQAQPKPAAPATPPAAREGQPVAKNPQRSSISGLFQGDSRSNELKHKF